MAKTNSKRGKIQVSRTDLAQTRYAIKVGLLSNRTKIKGNYISRKVAKKLDILQQVGAVPEFEPNPATNRLRITAKPRAVPVKVPPRVRKDFRASGLFLSNGRGIAPKDKAKEYQDALNTGVASGLVEEGIGYSQLMNIDEFSSIEDMHRAIKEKVDSLPLAPNEVYSFTYEGHYAKGGRTFHSGTDLVKYLERYQFTGMSFNTLSIFRMDENAYIPKTRELHERLKPRKSRRKLKNEAAHRSFNERRMAEKAAKKAAEQRAYRERKKALLGDALYDAQEAARKRAARKNKSNAFTFR